MNVISKITRTVSFTRKRFFVHVISNIEITNEEGKTEQIEDTDIIIKIESIESVTRTYSMTHNLPTITINYGFERSLVMVFDNEQDRNAGYSELCQIIDWVNFN